jgi:acetyl esterase/lipase
LPTILMVSWQTTTASLFSRFTVKQLVKRGASVEKLRKNIGAIERLYPQHPPGFEFAYDHPLPHCDAEWVRAKAGRTDRVILHFPGGAYVARLPNLERMMMSRICRAANAHARIVFYRLAPEHPFPAGHEDCLAAYRQLLDLGIAAGRIVLSGISAGGGMALGIAMAIRDQGWPAPAGVVALSALTDLTDPHAEGSSRVVNARRDPVLSGKRGMEMREIYVGGVAERLTHPYVSPMHGDFAGLPPLFFQVGSTEILLDDSRRCAELAHAAGVTTELDLWERMPHGWQAMPFVPESERAIERIGDFVRSSCP